MLFEVLGIEAVECLGSENATQILVSAFVFDEEVYSMVFFVSE